VVVIHGPKEVDPLAVELARKEGLVLALSNAAEETMISALSAIKA
jgi:predicted transcriptional regulator